MVDKLTRSLSCDVSAFELKLVNDHEATGS